MEGKRKVSLHVVTLPQAAMEYSIAVFVKWPLLEIIAPYGTLFFSRKMFTILTFLAFVTCQREEAGRKLENKMDNFLFFGSPAAGGFAVYK